MAKTEKLPEFEAGHGYDKEDWDAIDFPEMTDEELDRLRPAVDVLPPEFYEAMRKAASL